MDVTDGFSPRKSITCTTKCAVICGNNAQYKTGSASGSNANLVCKAAKKSVDAQVPVGCIKKHCSPCSDCGGD